MENRRKSNLYKLDAFATVRKSQRGKQLMDYPETEERD